MSIVLRGKNASEIERILFCFCRLYFGALSVGWESNLISMIATLIALDNQALTVIRSWIDPQASWFSLVKILVQIFADAQVLMLAIILVGLWLWARFFERHDRLKREALRVFWITLFAFGVYWVVNLGIPARPRPEMISALPPLISHLPDNSFPSGHAIFWAASTFGLFAFSRSWLGWLSLGIGFLMCSARVIAGVHYPGDIIVGALFGLFLALIAYPVIHHQGFGRILVSPVVRAVKWIGL